LSYKKNYPVSGHVDSNKKHLLKDKGKLDIKTLYYFGFCFSWWARCHVIYGLSGGAW